MWSLNTLYLSGRSSVLVRPTQDSFWGLPQRDAEAKATHHFWMRIFSGRVPAWGGGRRRSEHSKAASARLHHHRPGTPACAATSFFRSPIVSSSLSWVTQSRVSVPRKRTKQCPRRRWSGDATHLHFTRIFLPCTMEHARRGRVSSLVRKMSQALPQATGTHQSVVEHDLNHQRPQPPAAKPSSCRPAESQRLRGGRPGCPALTWRRATIFCPPVAP